ncbi:MAG: F0F1 ATP synthase subunit A [Actinobacteria bacterium]|jgi:F-type H+-transporting ATPase subunit a|nr:F0F1 ATP synthase subunit A [Actinomycetota bacterium]
MEIHVEELFFWDPILLAGTPFEINRVVLLMFLASIVCVAFFLIGARNQSAVPRGIGLMAQEAYFFVRNNIAIDVIGREGIGYAPYLAALFYFIFFSNLLEIVPGINFPVTSRMAIPAALAALTYVIFIVVGVRAHGLGYFKDVLFPPGVPKLVYILLTPIELFSTFVIRPLTLAIRLLANMMAGHVLLTIFFLFTQAFIIDNVATMFSEGISIGALLGIPLGIVTFLVACLLIIFELLVISIQAYIFTMLTAFYIAESLHGAHEEDDDHTQGHEEEGGPEPIGETEGVKQAA